MRPCFATNFDDDFSRPCSMHGRFFVNGAVVLAFGRFGKADSSRHERRSKEQARIG